MNVENELTITFPKNLNSEKIETIIKQYFYKSKLKSYTKIIFDFSGVEWCEVLGLSMLSLWMLSLAKYKQKQLSFKSPKNDRSSNFLYNYAFYNFLEETMIQSDYSKLRKSYTPAISPMFPLTFNTKQEFQDLLNDLSDPERYEIKFKDIKNTEIVKNNAIHSVILKELSENVFIHTKCKNVNFIMTKVPLSESINHQKEYCSRYFDYEKAFFEKIRGQEYICIVISDSGKGLYKSLIDAFHNDTILNQKLKSPDPSESDIIKYSFLKHSTSRSDDERKEKLRQLLQSKTIKYSLPTGLYKVLNIVRNYNGFIYVRSGKSFVCYDFFSNDEPIITDNSKYKSFKDLAFFPGTQFKFYFPVELPQKKDNCFGNLSEEAYGSDAKPIFKYISIDQYIQKSFSKFDNISVTKIQALIDKIDSHFVSHKRNTVLVFDACEFSNLLSKNITHIIVSQLMLNQSKTFSTVIVNVSTKKILDFIEDFKGEFNEELKPIICFDRLFKLHVLGTTDEDLKTIVQVLRNKSIKGYEGKLKRIEHLLIKTKEQVEFKFSRKLLLKFLLASTQEKLSSFIINPANSIFDADKKVLIPGRYYCLGFFEISNIFDARFIVDAFRFVLSIYFQKLKPDYIITLGENCNSIVDELYSEYRIIGIQPRAKKFYIEYPLNFPQIYKISKQLESKKSIIIITDVIGTAGTLRTAIDLLKDKYIKEVFSFVNTNKEIKDKFEVNLKSYELKSIVNKPLKFHMDMPKNWNYIDVFLIDMEKNRIIQKEIPAEGPLWIKIDKKTIFSDGNPIEIFKNTFLEKTVEETRCFYNGHFISRNNHLTCLFNIPALIEDYSSVICDKIIEYVESQLITINSLKDQKIKVSCIIFPTFNPGLDKISESIASKLDYSILLPIEDLEIGLNKKYDFSNSAVVIIDDAFISGSTTDKLIDIASNNAASHIFVFSLLKRGNPFQGRRFEKNKQYGDSTIQARYLVDAEMPIYKERNCPVCQAMNQLERIKRKLDVNENLSILLDHIDNILLRFRPKNISTIFQEDIYLKKALHDKSIVIKDREKNKFSYVNIRWKLELAKIHFGMRKDLNDILKNHITNPEASLMLLSVLSDEKFHFLTDSKYRKNIFYGTFRINLLQACKYFLKSIEKISNALLFSVINVLISFDEEYYIENFEIFLEKTIFDQNKLLTLLLLLFFTESSNKAPRRLSYILKNISTDERYRNYHQILTALSYVLDNIVLNKRKTAKIRIDSYNDIKLRIHNINHKIKDCLYCYNFLEGDKERLNKSWAHLLEDLNILKRSLNRFKNSLTSETNIKRINQFLTKLEMSIDEIINLFKIDDSFTMLPFFLNHICEKTVDRNTPDGIVRILEDFKIDICRLCYETLDREKALFEKEKKSFDFHFPDEPFTVLGEESDVFLIFSNLIENSLMHSNGSFLYILGLIDEEKRSLEILFIDDGKLKKDFQIGIGLDVVTKSCNQCGGSFNILQRDDTHGYSKEIEDISNITDYNTIAKVSLPVMLGR